MEEFRQLKETLQKMPSFKGAVLGQGGQLPLPSLKEQPPAPGHSLPTLAGEKVPALPLKESSHCGQIFPKC